MRINWFEELKKEDVWENKTTRVLSDVLNDKENERFKEVAVRLEVLEDNELVGYWEENLSNYEPMMNYGHLLETEPEDDKILDVALKTNCSVMKNTETDEYFIVLNGGGMDLSQDIGLAYFILERWIPESFISSISKQKGLSISKEDFKILKSAIIEQTQNYSDRFKTLKERWEEII